MFYFTTLVLGRKIGLLVRVGIKGCKVELFLWIGGRKYLSLRIGPIQRPALHRNQRIIGNLSLVKFGLRTGVFH